MRKPTYFKWALGLTTAGLLFSGYLSGVSLFSRTCAFGESCPYFWGYPACYYGFVMYLVMFAVTLRAVIRRTKEDWPIQVNATVSFLGMLFAGYFVIIEFLLWFSGAGWGGGQLGLPSCVYGLIFYIVLLVMAAVMLRRKK